MKLLTLIALTLVYSTGLMAADLANGKKVWKKVNCALCHGPKGLGKASEIAKIKTLKGPVIAGLDAAYIVKQMKAIQKGKAEGRKKKNYTMMKTKIKKLKPKDIADVAAYVQKMGKKAKSIYGKKFE